jgi:hypothetical protein
MLASMDLQQPVDHPHLLLAAVVLSLPAMLPLARFFFTDFDTFKRDLRLEDPISLVLWWFGWPIWMYSRWRDENELDLRIVLFIACYAAVVLGIYHLLLKLGHYH